MKKTKKQFYSNYPIPYYYIPKTKKLIKDFRLTYGNSFKPQDFFKEPKKKIILKKSDNVNNFVGNILDLYNIDYNPQFLDFSLNNFHSKIKGFIKTINNKDLYLDSVEKIKNKSEVLELQKVLNEHELHLILETLDLLLYNAKTNKKQFSKNIQTNMKKWGQKGGSADIAQYDIFAFLNGDKRKNIKKRICDIIYYNDEDIGKGKKIDKNLIKKINIKKKNFIENEIIDVCFNAFLQTTVYGDFKLGAKEKDRKKIISINQKILASCKEKSKEGKGIDYNFGTLKKPKFKIVNSEKFKKLGGEEKEKNILRELIDTFNEVQIADTDLARAKEKRMKDYLANISFVAMMGGLLPPEFFGEDADYNPFDVLSTVICIFEGSTVCAVMSALPLFSPIIDGLSTFATVRKIIQRLGGTGKMGKRSGAAMKKAQQVKIDKLKKQEETITQLQTNISKASKNLKKTTNQIQKDKILANLKKMTNENKKLTGIVKDAARKQKDLKTINAKKYLKGHDKLIEKINKGDPLNSADKLQLTKIQEYATLEGKSLDKILEGANLTKTNLKKFNETVNASPELESIIKLGERNGKFSVDGLTLADEAVKTAKAVKTGKGTDQYDTVAQNFDKAEEIMDLANIAKGGSAKIVQNSNEYKKLENIFGEDKLKTMMRGQGKDAKIIFSKIEADEIFKFGQKLKGGEGTEFISHQINVATKQLEMMKSGSFRLDEAFALEKHFKLYSSKGSSKASETVSTSKLTNQTAPVVVKNSTKALKQADNPQNLAEAAGKLTREAAEAREAAANAARLVEAAEAKRLVAEAPKLTEAAASQKATAERLTREAAEATKEAGKAAGKAAADEKRLAEAAAGTVTISSVKSVKKEITAKIDNFKLVEPVKPLADPLEQLQQILDTTASAYLIQYNANQEIEAIKDRQLDLEFTNLHNKVFDSVTNGASLNAFGSISKMFNPVPGLDLSKVLEGAQKIIKPTKCNGEGKQKANCIKTQKDRMIMAKGKKGIRERRKKFMYESNGNVFNITKGENNPTLTLKKKNNNFERKRVQYLSNQMKRNIGENMFAPNKNTQPQIGTIITEEMKLIKNKQERDRKETLKNLVDNYEGTSWTKSKRISKGNRKYLKQYLKEKKGGGKKNNTMRNEIFNDNDLSIQLDKFNIKFKSKMIEFNEPLEQMMRKRSHYRIKQKKNLKQEHLYIYRNMKKKIEGLVEDNEKMEFELFEKMNNSFKEYRKTFFERMELLSKNSFMRNTVEIGTYYETKKLLKQYDDLENKINELLVLPEIKTFKELYDKILKNIVLQEEKVKKVKTQIQEFKSKDKELDIEKLKLQKLISDRDNYNAKTKKEEEYAKGIVELKKIQKKIDETQVFVNYGKKLNKDNLSIESFNRNKSAIFVEFKKKIVDEIEFIRNEYDIAVFLSLNIPEIKKLDLVKLLQGIYIDITRIKMAFQLINKNYNKKNKKLNIELEEAKKQLKFYYENLSKIKLKDDKKVFHKRFKNRERNLKLLTEIHNNIIKEYFVNINFIEKCKDLLVFCDFEINTIKHSNISKETKSLLLSDKIGIIDITDLHENQDIIEIKTDQKELITIFNNILKLKKKFNKSRKSVYKSITDKEIKLSKLRKKLKQTKNDKKTKKLQKQIKEIDKKILTYNITNMGYMNFENPLNILVFYKILQPILIKGKEKYKFNKITLKKLNIKLTKKLKNKLNEINKFIINQEII